MSSCDPACLLALRALPLVASIEPERWEALISHIDFVELDSGDTLYAARQSSENLYLVVRGGLCLFLPDEGDRVRFNLQSRGPGETAGDFAVLNGRAHLVSAEASSASLIARFPRFAFDLLVDLDPAILAHVYDTAARLSRRVTLARVYLGLFGHVEPAAMDELLEITDVRHLHSGQVLFEEGDPADGLYVVVSGRLCVETLNTFREPVLLAEVGAPETVGELALLSDSSRSATVFATRESMVGFLDSAAFDRLIGTRPELLRSLSRLIVRRHVENAKRNPNPLSPDRTFVLIPLDTRLPIRRFLQQLKRELRVGGKPLVLDPRGFDTLYGRTGAAQTNTEDVFNSAIAEWLDDKENRYDEVLYLADPVWSAWTLRCLNRADRIVLLANARSDTGPALRDIERQLQAHLNRSRIRRPVELVLLHPASTDAPSGTRHWLAPRTIQTFHHVRLDDRRHISRLARRFRGTARGLVFSGGGARGFAHLGVQRAIEEQQLAIDMIGGASMGALLGASMAMGQSSDVIKKLASTFGNKRALFDYTLPLAALMKSAKLTQFCKSVYGETRIEDLWVPWYGVSSNLSDGSEVIHEQGLLWRAVRSTISLPGIFTPVPGENGELLIDGAVLNTFPVDIMVRKLGNGQIMGVNVSQIAERENHYNYGTSLSGWRSLLINLMPGGRSTDYPRLIETVFRATDIKSIVRLNETRALLDVLIEPDVSQIALMEFSSYDRIADIGYAAAVEALDRIGMKHRQREGPVNDPSPEPSRTEQASGLWHAP